MSNRAAVTFNRRNGRMLPVKGTVLFLIMKISFPHIAATYGVPQIEVQFVRNNSTFQ